MSESPYTAALGRVTWQMFVTLTLRRSEESRKRLEARFFCWMDRTSRLSGVHRRAVLWCRRAELGEQTGRLHFHCLIGNLPKGCVTQRLCWDYCNLWESLGGGIARARAFDAESEGPQYLLKALSKADVYESSKFGGKADLMLSESLVEMVTTGRTGQRGPWAVRR